MATRKRVGSRKIKNRAGGKRKRNTRAKRGGKMMLGGQIPDMENKWVSGFKANRVIKTKIAYMISWVPAENKFIFNFSPLKDFGFGQTFVKGVISSKLKEYLKKVFNNNPPSVFGSEKMEDVTLAMTISNDKITSIKKYVSSVNNGGLESHAETELLSGQVGDWNIFKKIIVDVNTNDESALVEITPPLLERQDAQKTLSDLPPPLKRSEALV